MGRKACYIRSSRVRALKTRRYRRSGSRYSRCKTQTAVAHVSKIHAHEVFEMKQNGFTLAAELFDFDQFEP